MNRDNEFMKKNNDSVVGSLKGIFAISLLIFLSIMLILQGCNTEQNKKDIAVNKVANLFEAEDEEKVKEGKSGKIKDSTGQEQIREAIEAIDKIDTSNEKHNENYGVVFALQSAVLLAQAQLDEREGTEASSDNNSQNEQPEQYQPQDDDVIWIGNELKNKDILEEFMNDAGENGENHGLEIRVVKDEGEKGVVIYDLESIYDKNANQGWIEVAPDLSHYIESEDDGQNVFNMRQQCGYMSEDKQARYYKLNECYTHWEYPLLPTIADN